MNCAAFILWTSLTAAARVDPPAAPAEQPAPAGQPTAPAEQPAPAGQPTAPAPTAPAEQLAAPAEQPTGPAEQPAARAEAAAAPAPQVQRTPKVMEIDASAAYSFLVSSRTSNGTTLSRRNGGPGGAISALLRTGYFLSPFLDVSFHPLLASTDRFDLDAALGGPVVLRSSLLAFGIVAGAAYDVSRLRLRAGLGWTDVMVRSRSGALRNSEWDMSYFASASALLWKAGWLSVGIEGRAGIINDAGISFVTIGLVAGSDVFRWPRDH